MKRLKQLKDWIVEAYKTVFDEGIVLFLLVVGVSVFLIIMMMHIEPILSRDEVCQKNFGKEYVYVNNGRSADFCVDNSGVPKYPKTWNERKA